jgi:hypothetical protein
VIPLSVEDNNTRVKEKLRALVREAAAERVRIYSRRDDFELTEMPADRREGSVLGNWMSLILMGGDAARMTLKLHFAYQDIKNIAYPIYGGKKPEDISDAQATDFVKELCNVIAGYLVQIFEENDLSLGLSLPLCTRGLYEVFSDYSATSGPLIRYSDHWVLQAEGIRLPGTVLFEIMDAGKLEKLLDYQLGQHGAGDDEDDDEGFDFL